MKQRAFDMGEKGGDMTAEDKAKLDKTYELGLKKAKLDCKNKTKVKGPTEATIKSELTHKHLEKSMKRWRKNLANLKSRIPAEAQLMPNQHTVSVLNGLKKGSVRTDSLHNSLKKWSGAWNALNDKLPAETKLTKVTVGPIDPTGQDEDLKSYAAGKFYHKWKPTIPPAPGKPAAKKKMGRWGRKKGKKNCRRRITPRIPKSVRADLNGKAPLPEPGTLPPPVLPRSDKQKTKLKIFKMAQKIQKNGHSQASTFEVGEGHHQNVLQTAEREAEAAGVPAYAYEPQQAQSSQEASKAS